MSRTGKLLGFATGAALLAALMLPMSVSAQGQGTAQGQNAGQAAAADQAGAADQAAAPAQPAAAGEGATAEAPATQEAGKESRKLRIFELQHRNPHELMQFFHMMRSGGQAGQFGLPAGQTTLGFRGTGSGSGEVSIATSPEHKLLLVRGTEEQIQQIESLVKAVDVEAGQLSKQEFQGVHLFPVSRDKGSQMQAILSQLNLSTQMMQMGDLSFVVFRSTEENQDELSQVEEVINRLGQAREEQPQEEQPQEEQPQEEQQQQQQQQQQQGQEGQAPATGQQPAAQPNAGT